MADFLMPFLGADMSAGTLTAWLKRPGDAVARGDIIAVVDTQKGAIEIEVFEDGVVERLAIEPGTKVPVGTVLATIRSATPPQDLETSGPRDLRTSSPQRLETSGPHVRSTPSARRRAAEHGIDLRQIHGTGPQGAVTREDVEAFAARTTPEAPAPFDRAGRATGMRAAIAAAMTRSKRDIPHYYLSTDIDMRAALEWLRRKNESRPVTERLLPIALLIKAVSLALADVPELNGHWVDGAFRPGEGRHIGCAIALRGGGLIAPAVHDADRKALPVLMREILDLVARARAGSLKSSELADPTITVTNLGEQGVDATFAIIHPPQVAIVGFGRIADRAVVVDGAVTARPTITASLSADHRVSDGHRGGVFLASVDRRLQSPEQL